MKPKPPAHPIARWIKGKLFKYDLVSWSDFIYLSLSSVPTPYALAGSLNHLTPIIGVLHRYHAAAPDALLTADTDNLPNHLHSIPVLALSRLPDNAPTLLHVIVAAESANAWASYLDALRQRLPHTTVSDLYATAHPCPIGSLTVLRNNANLHLKAIANQNALTASQKTLANLSDRLRVSQDEARIALSLYWQTLMAHLTAKHTASRVAFYGAGAHTRWLLDTVLPPRLWPHHVYDDTTTRPLPVPVFPTVDVNIDSPSAVVVSSDAYHHDMTRKLLTTVSCNAIEIIDPYAAFPSGTLHIRKQPATESMA